MSAVLQWLDSLVTRDESPVWYGRADEAVTAAVARGLPGGLEREWRGLIAVARAEARPQDARDVFLVADAWTPAGFGTRAGSAQAGVELPSMPEPPGWFYVAAGAALVVLFVVAAKEARAWMR